MKSSTRRTVTIRRHWRKGGDGESRGSGGGNPPAAATTAAAARAGVPPPPSPPLPLTVDLKSELGRTLDHIEAPSLYGWSLSALTEEMGLHPQDLGEVTAERVRAALDALVVEGAVYSNSDSTYFSSVLACFEHGEADKDGVPSSSSSRNSPRTSARARCLVSRRASCALAPSALSE